MTTRPTLTAPEARAIIAAHWPPSDTPHILRGLLWRGCCRSEQERANAAACARLRAPFAQPRPGVTKAQAQAELLALSDWIATTPLAAPQWPPAKRRRLATLHGGPAL